MSEEEKEAIEYLKATKKDVKMLAEENRYDKKGVECLNKNIDIVISLINKQQKEIELKDKVIDKMAQEIFIEYNPHFNTPEQVKEYFYKEKKDEK